METNKKICTAVYALFTAKSSFRFVCYTHKTNHIENKHQQQKGASLLHILSGAVPDLAVWPVRTEQQLQKDLISSVWLGSERILIQ